MRNRREKPNRTNERYPAVPSSRPRQRQLCASLMRARTLVNSLAAWKPVFGYRSVDPGYTISQSSGLTSTQELLSVISAISQSLCAATSPSRASVAEMIVIAIRGPMLRMLRPTGDIRMRVSIAVRYRSGSRFLVQGREGRSGRGFCTGARSDERRGRGAVRREVTIRWDGVACGADGGAE